MKIHMHKMYVRLRNKAFSTDMQIYLITFVIMNNNNEKDKTTLFRLSSWDFVISLAFLRFKNNRY